MLTTDTKVVTKEQVERIVQRGLDLLYGSDGIDMIERICSVIVNDPAYNGKMYGQMNIYDPNNEKEVLDRWTGSADSQEEKNVFVHAFLGASLTFLNCSTVFRIVDQDTGDEKLYVFRSKGGTLSFYNKKEVERGIKLGPNQIAGDMVAELVSHDSPRNN